MPGNPLETIVDEMFGCTRAGLHFGAISLAVAIPSICASLSIENGRSNGEDYKAWCRDNLYPNKGFELTSPEELVSLRNGFSHQSRTELLNKKLGKMEPASETNRVAFIISSGRSVFADNIFQFDDDRFYAYGIEEFCGHMGSAALEWYEKNKDDPVVSANLEKMTNYRKFGDLDAIY